MIDIKHLGDITKISGYTAPIVDCIIGCSPCQDLSVAGKRAGLDGERSGLYIEQVRIVKEMRERDERDGRTGVDIRPRYMVWENVPGAFSSNKGDDFRIVLEELAKVKDKNAVIPMPDKGKWTTSGCILGDGWSIAWRVLDAQFWGVPQRRRRIALVADFGGQSAPEILFVRESVSGHTDEGKQTRKEAPDHASRGFGADDRLGADQYNAVILGDTVSTLGVNCGISHGRQCVLEPQTAYTLKIRSGCDGGGKGALVQEDLSATLATNNDQYLFQPVYALDRASYNQGKNAQFDFEISDKGINSPLVAKGPGAVCYTIDEKCANTYVWEEQANTLAARDYKQPQAVCYSVDQGGGKSACNVTEGQAPTLTCTHGGEPAVCYSINHQGGNIEQTIEGVTGTLTASMNSSGNNKLSVAYAVDCRNGTEDTVNGALQSNSAHSLNGNNVVRTRYIVRRLTPLECERLQGYPDGWTDIGEWTDSNGKKRQTSDAARYKALGNSIALPPWKWVLKRICACYERDATMASLFDGIGGFPYLWEQLNGKGTCLWASEIEEFPIAVTKVRIGGDT